MLNNEMKSNFGRISWRFSPFVICMPGVFLNELDKVE
jgi:hypothetical protein